MLLPFSLKAQEKVAYRITYDCDALYDKTLKTYRWNLDIGNSTAVFYNPNNRKHDEAYQALQNTDDIPAMINSIKQLGSKYPNRSSMEILIGAPEKDAYTYINEVGFDLLMYHEKLPDIDWKLSDSTKSICGYVCNQAKAEVYGREWTVWYSTEIPMSYGPYVLGGLPGLILEAVDDDNIFHFVTVGIETSQDESIIYLSGADDAVRCSRKKYLNLRKSSAEQTYTDAVANLVGGTGKVISITDASGKDISNQKQSEKNYLDID